MLCECCINTTRLAYFLTKDLDYLLAVIVHKEGVVICGIEAQRANSRYHSLTTKIWSLLTESADK